MADTRLYPHRPTFCTLLCLFVFVACLAPRRVCAIGEFRVDDDAHLLTTEEGRMLRESYSGLGQYVDAAFVSTAERSDDVEDFAELYVSDTFGDEPTVIFVIDMYNRQVCVYANSAGRELISEDESRSITDNVYEYAGRNDYYGCADAAFSQILTCCEGGQVETPMRHVTNFLMAMVLGILICFFIANVSRNKRGLAQPRIQVPAQR